MRKLFRDKGSGEFLRSNGEWTPNMKLACDFLNKEYEELRHRVRGLKEVEWLYSLEDAEHDFTIPLPPVARMVQTDKP